LEFGEIAVAHDLVLHRVGSPRLIQAAHTRWFLEGGDLATIISQSLEVWKRGAGGAEAWSVGRVPRPGAKSGPRPRRQAPG
jgi:hypothetical protein